VIALAVIQETLVQSTAEGRLRLWGELALSDPWFLSLVPLVLGAVFLGRRRHVAARLPVLPAELPVSTLQRLAWIPAAMKVVALLLAVLALSRPLRGSVEFESEMEGVDIALLLDRSSSMEARADASAPRRFDIAKRVLGNFARRRMTDTVGAADNVALFAFAGYTDLVCPFTLDADSLSGLLDALDVETRAQMDGTGIGVAIARAVDVLRELDSDSRIIVLLTDGEETINLIHPVHAGRLAAEEGIKVYTIFVGPKVAWRRTVFGRRKQELDTSDLETIAEITDARFFHAEDETQLEEVYTAIESLERREREETRYAQHFDLYPLLLLPAFLLYILSWLSVCTWARRLP